MSRLEDKRTLSEIAHFLPDDALASSARSAMAFRPTQGRPGFLIALALVAALTGCPRKPAPQGPAPRPFAPADVAAADAGAAEAEVDAPPPPPPVAPPGPPFAWAPDMGVILAGPFALSADSFGPGAMLVPQIGRTRDISGSVHMAVSPDRTLVAVTDGWTGGVSLWEIDTGRLRFELSGTGGPAHAVSFTPDGATLVTVSAGGVVKSWDLARGTLVRSFHTLDCPRENGFASCHPSAHVRFSADTDRIAVQDFGGPIGLYNVPDGRSLATFDSDAVSLDRAWNLSLGGRLFGTSSAWFSPDGSLLALATDDGTVELRDAATGSLRRTLVPTRFPDDDADRVTSPEAIRTVAFSPDGATVAAGGANGRLYLWDSGTGDVRAAVDAFRPDRNEGDNRDDGLWSLAFSPDGRLLAAGGSRGALRIWDVARGEFVWRADLMDLRPSSNDRGGDDLGPGDSYDSPIERLAFSPDGLTLATGPHLHLWNAVTGERRTPAESLGVGVFVSFTADGAAFAAFDAAHGCLAVREASAGGLRSCTPLLPLQELAVHSLASTRDGTRAFGRVDQGFAEWDLGSGDLLPEAQGPCATEGMGETGESSAFSLSLAVDPGGTQFAEPLLSPISGEPDGFLLCDVATGTVRLRRLVGLHAVLRDLAFGPDGAILAAAYAIGGNAATALRLWNVETLEVAAELTRSGEEWRVVALRPDGARLAALTDDGRLLIVDPTTGASFAAVDSTVIVAPGGTGRGELQWSPDGATLAVAGSGSTIALWDADSGTLRATLDRHEAGVTALAFSPDGRFLASVGMDGLLAIWNMSDGSLRVEDWSDSPGETVVFRGDGSAVFAGGLLGLDLLRTGDGARLRVRRLGSGDRKIRLVQTDGGRWDADDPAAVRGALVVLRGTELRAARPAMDEATIEACRSPGLFGEFLAGGPADCPALAAAGEVAP